jgi:hypothetical protein
MQPRPQIVPALVSALEPIVQISELTIQIRHTLDAHPDGKTFRSLFADPNSWLCAASMLPESGDRRSGPWRSRRSSQTDGPGCQLRCRALVDGAL